MNHSLKAKIVSGAVAATLLLGSASVVFGHEDVLAQNPGRGNQGKASTTPPGQGKQAEKRAATSTSTTTRKTELKLQVQGKIEAQAQKRVKTFIQNHIRKFEKAIEVVGKQITKVEERIAKFKEKGATTARSETFLAEAKAKLELAKTDLGKIKTTYESAVGSTTPKASIERLKGIFDGVNKNIRASHKALVDAISNLKGASTGKKGTGTTTPPTSTTTPPISTTTPPVSTTTPPTSTSTATTTN